MAGQDSLSELTIQEQNENLIIRDSNNHHDHKSRCDFDPDADRIIKGFKHFLHNQFCMYPEKFEELAESQHPKFLVISCSDSRTSPSHVLNFQLGEAFEARNIANLVPSFNKLRHSGIGAIIEYAVGELKVENILVIGHSRCGGISRLMSHPEDGSVPFDFIDDWVNIALPAKIKVKAEHWDLPIDKQKEICAQEAVNLSLVNLQTYPYVQKAIAEGKLALRGGFYDFVVGSFKLWEMKTTISPPIIIDCHP